MDRDFNKGMMLLGCAETIINEGRDIEAVSLLEEAQNILQNSGNEEALIYIKTKLDKFKNKK